MESCLFYQAKRPPIWYVWPLILLAPISHFLFRKSDSKWIEGGGARRRRRRGKRGIKGRAFASPPKRETFSEHHVCAPAPPSPEEGRGKREEGRGERREIYRLLDVFPSPLRSIDRPAADSRPRPRPPTDRPTTYVLPPSSIPAPPKVKTFLLRRRR